MQHFVQKHADKILGVLSGFDRLVFRGTLRQIAFVYGMNRYLLQRELRFKDFGDFAQSCTEQLKRATADYAQAQGRPIVYLASAQTNKEEVALEVAERDGIRQGLVCILSSVEPCKAFDIYRNAATKHLDLVVRERKCLHFYHYRIDPVFGWMNARIQSWLPFNVQICLNGREWLARQMDREALTYRRADNCFLEVSDFARAQALLDAQSRVSWPAQLERIAADLDPVQAQILGLPLSYYWSAHQSEWATDVAFRDHASLARIYPPLLLHAITSFSSPDVMRFLGKKLHGRFQGELVSDLRRRPEGVRIKHRAGENSIKLYDKQGSVLRTETTINDPAPFLVHRAAEGDPDGPKSRRKMRRGVADLQHRTQLSQAANERYLDALADVDTSTPVGELLDRTCKAVTYNGRRVRGLRPFTDDLELLGAISRGEYAVQGLRNAELQKHLFHDAAASVVERRRRSAKVTRLIRLLRAHGMLRKIPNSRSYRVTSRGRQLAAVALSARRLSLATINSLAA